MNIPKLPYELKADTTFWGEDEVVVIIAHTKEATFIFKWKSGDLFESVRVWRNVSV